MLPHPGKTLVSHRSTLLDLPCGLVPGPLPFAAAAAMSFFWSYFQGAWASGLKSYEATDLKAWNEFLDQAEKDRQRE